MPSGNRDRLAAWVYMPINAKTGDPLIFFEDVAAMEWSDFQSVAQNMNCDLIERQMPQQIHIVAGVASAKMRRARWPIIISLSATAVWFVLLAWSNS